MAPPGGRSRGFFSRQHSRSRSRSPPRQQLFASLPSARLQRFASPPRFSQSPPMRFEPPLRRFEQPRHFESPPQRFESPPFDPSPRFERERRFSQPRSDALLLPRTFSPPQAPCAVHYLPRQPAPHSHSSPRRSSPPRFRSPQPHSPPRRVSAPRFHSPPRSLSPPRSHSPPRRDSPPRSRSPSRRPFSPRARSPVSRSRGPKVSANQAKYLHAMDKEREHKKPSDLLARRVMTLSAFINELTDKDGKLLPPNERKTGLDAPIPVPLRHGETPREYEVQFVEWLSRNRSTKIAELQKMPMKERLARYSFAFSRLPKAVWIRSVSSKTAKVDRPRIEGSIKDREMPPRPKPIAKRPRSADSHKQPPASEPARHEVKRARTESTNEPRAQPSNESAARSATTSGYRADKTSSADAGKLNQSVSPSQLTDSTTNSPLADSADKQSEFGDITPDDAQQPPSQKDIKEQPKRPKSTNNEQSNMQKDTKQGSIHGESRAPVTPPPSAHRDEPIPSWAMKLFRRVEDLEKEVQGLRQQLQTSNKPVGNDSSMRCPNKDSVNSSKLSKSEHQVKGGEESKCLRFEKDFLDINDEILLNTRAVDESEMLVHDLMETEPQQAQELQSQIEEMREAIEAESSKRDAVLARLIVETWGGKMEEFPTLKLNAAKHESSSGESQDSTSSLQHAAHVRCQALWSKLKLQDRAIAIYGRAPISEDNEQVKEKLSLCAEAQAAREQTRRELKAEYSELYCLSERVRGFVSELLESAK